MAKNTKRKPSRKEEEEKKTAVNVTGKAAGGRAKRAKVESEPEYFEDKRNLGDLWRQIFPVGTEWHLIDEVFKYKWNFSNLENALEEGGELYGKKIYLFGCTESQVLESKDVWKVILIPVVIAVVSPFPPSDKIGIKSVQREAEEIVPMKQMKMDWVPYIPLENRDSMVEKLKSQIFILSCSQRRAGLRHLKIEQLKKFEYCLPYFFDPCKEDETEDSTTVDILFPADAKPVVSEYDCDWGLAGVEEFTDDLIKEDKLSEDDKTAFMEFVKEKVREVKKAKREARQARKKAREDMSEETKAAFEQMQVIKFYPVSSPDAPDVSSKNRYINRYYDQYYGKADKFL